MIPLRAGLIGLGMMGRQHARVLGSLDCVELVAVADPGGDPHSGYVRCRGAGVGRRLDRRGSRPLRCRRTDRMS